MKQNKWYTRYGKAIRIENGAIALVYSENALIIPPNANPSQKEKNTYMRLFGNLESLYFLPAISKIRAFLRPLIFTVLKTPPKTGVTIYITKTNVQKVDSMYFVSSNKDTVYPKTTVNTTEANILALFIPQKLFVPPANLYFLFSLSIILSAFVIIITSIKPVVKSMPLLILNFNTKKEKIQ